MIASLEAVLRAIFDAHLGVTCTAAVVRVQRSQEVLLDVAAGVTDLRGGLPATPATPFDLASITKIFTASAVLRLVDAHELSLNDRVASLLPCFSGTQKDSITVRHLLTHSAGFLAMGGLHNSEEGRANPRLSLLQRQLAYSPGESVIYSDVSFLLLGLLLEAVTTLPLDVAMRNLVLDPLGIMNTSYGSCAEAAATEFLQYRGKRLRGEVHDENARVLDGVAGHAGLFGPAGDVAIIARAYASPSIGFLSPRLILEATRLQAQSGSERRGLGWKLASRHPEAPENVFSAEAYGHTGFTGTAVWIDPKRDLTIILLTNRVYFGRDPAPIRHLRRSVFAAIVEEFAQTSGAGVKRLR